MTRQRAKEIVVEKEKLFKKSKYNFIEVKNMNLNSGLYRHYKGNDYYVFQVAHHSETREALVVYQCLYGDYSWWVRPLSMFAETVEIGGEIIPRFAFVKEISADEAAQLNR